MVFFFLGKKEEWSERIKISKRFVCEGQWEIGDGNLSWKGVGSDAKG